MTTLTHALPKGWLAPNRMLARHAWVLSQPAVTPLRKKAYNNGAMGLYLPKLTHALSKRAHSSANVRPNDRAVQHWMRGGQFDSRCLSTHTMHPNGAYARVRRPPKSRKSGKHPPRLLCVAARGTCRSAAAPPRRTCRPCACAHRAASPARAPRPNHKGGGCFSKLEAARCEARARARAWEARAHVFFWSQQGNMHVYNVGQTTP